MKTIKLYTLEDARKDMKKGASGIDCSIKKWEFMLNGLQEIIAEMYGKCGLCMEHSCAECPLSPKEDYDDVCCPKYTRACKALYLAVNRTATMAKKLEQIKQKDTL